MGHGVSLLGGQAVPLHGLLVVLGNTLAVVVLDPEAELGVGLPLLGRQAVPFRGLLVVLGNTLSVEVPAPEEELGVGVSLLGRQAVPPHGLLVVLGYALAGEVPAPEEELSVGVSLLRIQTQLFDFRGMFHLDLHFVPSPGFPPNPFCPFSHVPRQVSPETTTERGRTDQPGDLQSPGVSRGSSRCRGAALGPGRAERVLGRWAGNFGRGGSVDDPLAGREIARIEQAILKGNVGVLDEYGDLQGALKRIVELKKLTRKGSNKTIIEGFSTWWSRRVSRRGF